MDAPSLFRQRRWTTLYWIVKGLPSTSRTVSAVLNDPDPDRAAALAWAIAEADQDDEEPTSLVSQTPEVVVLQAIFDVIVSAFGGKDTWPRPVPRVTRMVEEARRAEQLEAVASIVALLTPWAAAQEP